MRIKFDILFLYLALFSFLCGITFIIVAAARSNDKWWGGMGLACMVIGACLSLPSCALRIMGSPSDSDTITEPLIIDGINMENITVDIYDFSEDITEGYL